MTKQAFDYEFDHAYHQLCSMARQYDYQNALDLVHLVYVQSVADCEKLDYITVGYLMQRLKWIVYQSNVHQPFSQYLNEPDSVSETMQPYVDIVREEFDSWPSGLQDQALALINKDMRTASFHTIKAYKTIRNRLNNAFRSRGLQHISMVI